MPKKINFIFLISLFIWILSQVYFFNPELFFVSLSVSSVVIFLVVKKIINKKNDIFWLLLTVNPLLLYLSASFYSAILTNQILIQLILAITAFLIFSYFKNIYYYYSFGAPERELKLRKLVILSSFLAFFAASATLYALPIFLNFSLSVIFIWLIVISSVLFIQLFIFFPKFNQDGIFKSINILILGELSGALLLLPLSYNVRALILAILFYLLFLFYNWRYDGRLIFQNIKWPVIITLIIIFIILFSARWR